MLPLDFLDFLFSLNRVSLFGLSLEQGINFRLSYS